MSNIFNSISARRPKKNVFDLSHEVKMSSHMAQLTPCLCMEVVPGDKFRVNTQSFVRMAPMLAPVMHRLDVHVHYFFVPNRLVWSDWESFITGGETGTSAPVFPRFRPTSLNSFRQVFTPGTLGDYLGVGSGEVSNDFVPNEYSDVSLLPFRAYQLIYNEYYRDQNLVAPVEIPRDGGIKTSEFSSLGLRNRSWEKDYFTSALPWAQRGPQATLPVGTVSEKRVLYDTLAGESVSGKIVDSASVGIDATNTPLYTGLKENTVPERYNLTLTDSEGTNIRSAASYDPNGTLYVEGQDIGAVTINELRRANKLQIWLEKNARGGGRYIESILNHFGVRSPDARLQRPEFLGGGKTPIVISEVLQTSSTDENSPQANMAGHGLAAMASNGFKYTAVEHGYIIGIVSILPRTSYQNGLPRHFRKFDKFDFFWPEFAHLGEQPIYNSEIYWRLANRNESNDATFGYTPRYAEYKYMQGRVAGDFKTSLDFWHLGRIFDPDDQGAPDLNEDFVEAQPINRIFADTSFTHKYWMQIHQSIRAIRPMPKYGTPTI
ncbi:major capsid protein [Tortoise microvirus 35]|nr:major capsid protein [Tortoise microvirus 35]